MRVSAVHLVPIHLQSQPPVLPHLVAHLGRAFGVSVLTHPLRFDPEIAFDRSRGQYHSTALLEQLLAEETGNDSRVLGVAGVDLFIPILTYVFGEAQLEGRAAVVSTYRLNSALYGLPADDRLLVDRLVKEATHELGHTYGLLHCPDPGCVMRSSTYVEDIDLKSASFCGRCAPALQPPRAAG